MHSPTRAILWEISARNRYALMFAFGVMPVCAVLAACTRWYLVWSGRPLPDETGDPGPLVVAVTLIVFSALLSLTSIFWSFSFTSIDDRGRFGGFPVRLFTLPLLTRSAAAPPVFAGVAALVASYAVWASMLFLLLRRNEPVPWLTLAWQLLVLATAFVSQQAIVWLLYPFRFMRMVVIALMGTGFLIVFLVGTATNFYQQPVAWFTSRGAGFLAAVAAASGVVHWERCGGWQNIGRVSVRLWRNVKRFSSAARAQFWFECRRKEMFGAGVIGLAMTAALMVWTVPEKLLMNPEKTGIPVSPAVEFSFFWILPMTTLLITSAMGASFGKSDPWGPEIAMSSFHAVRPLTTAQLVIAKWFAGLRMVLLAWVIFVLTCVAIVLVSQGEQVWFFPDFLSSFADLHPALVRWITNPAVLLTIFALQCQAVTASMSVVLSGQRRRVAINGWVGILTLGVWIGVIAWFAQRPNHFQLARPFLPWIAIALVIYKLWCAFSVFRKARRELLTQKECAALLLLWIVLAAGIVFSAAAALYANVLPKELIWFLAIWFLPSGEMPACVLHLAMNRHR